MRVYYVKNFDKGIVNQVEDFSIPENASPDSVNWVTEGDHIELSGGYQVLGTNLNVAGAITGLHTSLKVDGSYQVFRKNGQKLEYLQTAGTWAETGSNIFGAAGEDDEASFATYVSLAGYQTWVSSPNSGLFKIMTANPGSYRTMSTTFAGYITIQNGRLLMWNRGNRKNYIYGSWKDAQNSTTYTTVTGEAVGGSGSTAYSGTLAQATGTRTVFNVVITDGTRVLTDDKNGGFTGDGTGTINYVTGAYSVTFNTATTGSVTASYEYENSASKGLADFSFTSPTRLALEGFFLPQPTGGDILSIESYRTEFYCIHEKNTWLFSMPVDDLNPTNQVFREGAGMQNWRGSVATGDGIYYIDTSLESEPRIRLLTLEQVNNQVIPVVVTYNFNLSGLAFDKCAAIEWGNYILFACRTEGSEANNRVIAYNKIWKSVDVLNYFVGSFAVLDTVLLGSDPLIQNVNTLFTSFVQGNSLIANYWTGKLTTLEMEYLKKTKRLNIEGDINISQTIQVYYAVDRQPFVLLGTIEGNGAYVDTSTPVTIGSPTIGSYEIAGGTTTGVQASHYRREFIFQTPWFYQIQLKFVATGSGYASVSTIRYYDITTKNQKDIYRYREFL